MQIEIPTPWSFLRTSPACWPPEKRNETWLSGLPSAVSGIPLARPFFTTCLMLCFGNLGSTQFVRHKEPNKGNGRTQPSLALLFGELYRHRTQREPNKENDRTQSSLTLLLSKLYISASSKKRTPQGPGVSTGAHSVPLLLYQSTLWTTAKRIGATTVGLVHACHCPDV